MAKKEKGLTPMMQQFFSMKQQHPEALLLFRCGDFYETYCEDAVTAAQILGITLTKRNNGAGVKGDEMAGFPYHALDTYLPKLIRAGKRVAICDQLEDPKLTKKLVKRGITELVTPGVAMADNVLNYKENNFLAAVHFATAATLKKDRRQASPQVGLALLDISTGEFLTDEGTADYIEKLLSSFQPKEVLYNCECRQEFSGWFGSRLVTFEMDDWVFTKQNAQQRLLKHFQTRSLKGFGVDHLRLGTVAAGAILQYLELTQHTQISHITALRRIDESRYVRLDKFTARSLELVQPMHEDGVSLLDVVDRTATPMGARMLRRWVTFPLKDVAAINERQEVVELFFREPQLRQLLNGELRRMGDLERISARVAAGRVSPREMVQLKVALAALKPVKEACLASGNDALRRVGERIDLCEPLRNRIEHEMQPDPPQLLAKGNVMADGCSEELAELREIAHSGRSYLVKLQQREIEKTGITSLKVGYNNVFGYYLEVRNTYKDNVPADWIRKQTLAQAERYITEELKEYEEKIMGAEDRIMLLEERLYNELVVFAQDFIPKIQTNAAVVAQTDCLLSFAAVAEENKYIRPVVEDSDVLDIRQGRHPVIERRMGSGEHYVPNDICLDTTRQQIVIITGPNMAGKSALLRQTALIVLMAQTGCFVPAESAKIGVVDKIFTRVGASDNISLGESTFMVEMTEASSILNNVTPRSLVLFDELGRGTSTYDGISIAWAIVEYLHEQKHARARTLFATHYHELNEMEKSFSRVKNYNVSVREVNGEVVFLRRLERGGAEHSFGIHVAEIAGMPKSIVRRASVILKQLEADNAAVGTVTKPSAASIEQSREGMQLSFFQLDDPVLCQVRDEILELDINNLTPVEALNKLNEIKKIVTGK